MPVIKVGDYVEAGGKLIPGLLINIELKKLNYKIGQIDTKDPGAKVVDCTIFYEDIDTHYYRGTTTSLSNNIRPVSLERYKYLIEMGEELLRILWWYWKRCKVYSWEEFTNFYYNDPLKIMRWIPIKEILEPNIIEFGDGSIWECDKVKYKRKSRIRREKQKKHHIYLPINQLYGIHTRLF